MFYILILVKFSTHHRVESTIENSIIFYDFLVFKFVEKPQDSSINNDVSKAKLIDSKEVT